MWVRLRAMATSGGWGAGRGRGFERGNYGRSGSRGRGGGRHPSHLKGKEIGMFYKNKGLQKKRQREKAEVSYYMIKMRLLLTTCKIKTHNVKF